MKRLMVLLLSVLLSWSAMAVAGGVKTINKDELLAMLDSPDLVLLDVRRGKDWSASEFKIKGAVRLAPAEVESAIADLPKDKNLVFYCA